MVWAPVQQDLSFFVPHASGREMLLQAFTDSFLGMQPFQEEGKRVSLFHLNRKDLAQEGSLPGCAGQKILIPEKLRVQVALELVGPGVIRNTGS